MKKYKTVQLQENFQHIQNKYRHFVELNSTNSYLMNNQLEHGAVVWSDFQTAGRGRKQRNWISPQKQSILFSILLKDNLDEIPHYLFTFLSAVAVYETLDNYLDIRPDLKWPNDVLLSGKKVCGILVETKTGSKKIKKVVLGIGLNVNQKQAYFDGNNLQHGTSIRVQTGQKFERDQLLLKLLYNIDKNIQLSRHNQGQDILDKWRVYCPYLSQTVTIKTEQQKVTGIFQDIADDGAMILKTEQGQQKYYAGDVSFDKRSL